MSCYHWQIVVYLAWFSSLTHMACLTFSRSYLFHHTGQRTWRLAAMAVLVILLSIAFIPTGNFDWYEDQQGPKPQNYVLCHFGIEDIYADSTRTSAAVSIVLVVLGYCIRVVLLHEYLSRTLARQFRVCASQCFRSNLSKIRAKWDLENDPDAWSRHWLYRPLLALFLTIRIALDVLTSMCLEV